MEITADKVTVRLERGTVVITGFDVGEVLAEIGIEKVLETLDYSDIIRFVEEAEADKKELEALAYE